MNSSSEKTPTGIIGLDDALNGGMPKGTVCTISGGPGCGKTILAAEFLYEGITKFGDPGIYVSLGESKDEFLSNTKPFGWDFASLEREGKFKFVDFSFERLVNINVWSKQSSDYDSPSFPLDGLTLEEQTYINMIQNFVGTIIDSISLIEAKRIVIDPISSLRLLFPTEFISRREFLRIFTILRESKTTAMVLSELPKEEGFSLEEFVGSGVIRVNYRRGESGSMNMARTLTIFKMRGTAFNEKALSMRITSSGIEILGESLGF
ncbi:hypothetical protein NEF87_000829 [Candidatus Lokiarchaeum ossiferum]|uniref:KaiC domain-containing protein n=1 Tax=Candidatus Lokiarchaeum ossiferum TaxID=2951803 RepID=A0ABY6HM12_9ARCH|nr:hypothetical protein NEF87_000829 [Candidatus Lokiarchaeum sp. B-35]